MRMKYPNNWTGSRVKRKPPVRNKIYYQEYEEQIIQECLRELSLGSLEFQPHPVLGSQFSALRRVERKGFSFYSADDLCKAYPGRFNRRHLATALKRMKNSGKLCQGSYRRRGVGGYMDWETYKERVQIRRVA